MTEFHQTLAREGYVVVPNFLSIEETSAFKTFAKRIYDELAIHADDAPAGMKKNYQVWNGVWLGEMQEFLAKQAPSLLPSYFSLIRIARGRMRKHFGFRWRLYTIRSYFRRHVDMRKKVPWHIDADAVSIDRIGCVNLWIPFDAVGVTRPSLEIVPKSHLTMRTLPLAEGAAQHRQDEFVASIGKPVTPVLNAGDALVFDQFTLHRTQELELFNASRTSCEFRFEEVSIAEGVKRFKNAARRRIGAALRTIGVLGPLPN